MADKDQLDNIEKSRNTDEQLRWYQERNAYLDSLSIPANQFTDTFPVFASRQKVTRFVETLRYWELIENVPGDIFECGVAGGEFLMSMAHLSSIYEPHHYTRNVIGFDTFEGFTKPTTKDFSSKAKHMHEGGLAYDSFDYLEKAIAFYDRNRMIGNIEKIKLIKGDISTTLKSYLDLNPATVIGMLHLDLDLYKPTKDVLQNTRKHMAKGSIIIFDEINHNDYPGETLAVMEVLGLENIELKRVKEASMAAYVIL